MVAGGAASVPEFFDPVRLEWIRFFPQGTAWGAQIESDGVNFRISNLTTTAYGGIVTAAGSGYAQATTTVTPGTGNSTWQPIIGGALGAFTITAGGANYAKPPYIFIPPPPPPGIAATAVATLTAGAVSAITLTTAGAGYLAAPLITIYPDPTDPNFISGTAIANATATVVLTGAGTLTGLLLINFGTALATAPVLTVAGAGTTATATTNPATVVAAANDIITFQPGLAAF